MNIKKCKIISSCKIKSLEEEIVYECTFKEMELHGSVTLVYTTWCRSQDRYEDHGPCYPVYTATLVNR